MRNAAARTVHAELGRGWMGQKGGRGDTMGLHLVSGWWCRGCRGLHGEGARWRRIGRDEVTSCGRCIPKAGRCNAGVGRASSFGPFLDRIGSSGTGMHSNLLRSRQALEPIETQKRPADRKHGPASHGTKEQEPHSAGRRGQGLGVVEVRDQGYIAFICRTEDRRTAGQEGPLGWFLPPWLVRPFSSADEDQSTQSTRASPLSARSSCTVRACDAKLARAKQAFNNQGGPVLGSKFGTQKLTELPERREATVPWASVVLCPSRTRPAAHHRRLCSSY